MSQFIQIVIGVVFILILFLLATFEHRLSKVVKTICILAWSGLLLIFLSIRNIGLDLEPYRQIFIHQNVIPLSNIFSDEILGGLIEPFFIYLISLIKQFNMDFSVFLFISAVFPIAILLRITLKTSGNNAGLMLLIFFLLYFYMGTINIIRHFFAAMIFLSAMYSLSKQKYVNTYIQTIFSMFVHYSNIAVLGFIVFVRFSWSRMKYFAVLIAIALLGFGLRLIINPEDLMYQNISYKFIWKFLHYLDYERIYISEFQFYLINMIDFFPYILNIVIVSICIKNMHLFNDNKFDVILIKSTIFGTFISTIFITFGAYTMGLRFNFLFGIGNFILITKLILYSKGSLKKNVLITFIYIFVIYNLLVILYYLGIHNPNSKFYLF